MLSESYVRHVAVIEHCKDSALESPDTEQWATGASILPDGGGCRRLEKGFL